MKKKLFSILLTAALVFSLGTVTAYADDLTGNGGSVTFTSQAEMDEQFSSANIAEAISRLQPGDSVTVTVDLANDNDVGTDWYMTNEVLQTLEEQGGHGGAYTYRLAYTAPDGEVTELYNSDTVGGEDESAAGQGLKQATNAMGDWFFLGTLTKGQAGHLSLTVALDGETQGNSYQNTAARLKMNFAVELDDTNRRTTYVRTGDENDSFLYMGLMGGAGALVLLIAIYGYVSNKKKKEGGAGNEKS